MRALAILVGVCLCLTPAAASTSGTRDIGEKLLWRDPGPIAGRDLYWGSGSELRAPQPPFTFVSEDMSGTKPKVSVTDAKGVSWSVKLATEDPAHNEVHAEIAASRLVWALGYFVDETYFVPTGRFDAIHDLKRAAAVVGTDGTFKTARFERKGKELEWRGEWNLEKDSPFRGTKELSGLQMLMLVLGNWDVRPPNSAIVRVRLPNNETEDRYLIADLGTAFGQMKGGANERPTRWNLTDYTNSRLLSGIVQGKLTFRSPIQGNEPFQVPLEHARWFVGMSSQLTVDQIRKAFEAAGATPQEADGFSAQVLKRFQELTEAAGRK